MLMLRGERKGYGWYGIRGVLDARGAWRYEGTGGTRDICSLSTIPLRIGDFQYEETGFQKDIGVP